MTMESRATLVAFGSLKRASGVTITYRRAATSGTFVAVPGDTLVDTENDEGQTVRTKVRDYLVLRTDFESLIGAGLRPHRGDEIDETVADYARTFKVIELAGNESRWWDKSGQVLRVHAVETQKTSTTTAGA